MPKDICALGEVPPLGEMPERMHAQVIRQSRFGPPAHAFVREEIQVPELGPRDVLVYVMAAGVNYNNVWAGLGVPMDVIAVRRKAGEKEDFHIGGSDASSIVWKVGSDVKGVKVGDEVVTHCGSWDQSDPAIAAGKDPMYIPSFQIWGYETNWGSFAQFARAQDHQCLPKPQHLSWEEAAAYMLVGATAYRMLHGWAPNALKAGEPVLIWGGAGGLGSMAIQIAKAAGAVPVAVTSDNVGSERDLFCRKLGAVGTINRKDFSHWGPLPHWKDEAKYYAWKLAARAFGERFGEVLGAKRNPTIVFEHPGEETVPTSIYVCETGGMVVICAGTSGFNATLDLRYHWMRQKRFQGSHFANDEQAKGINDLVLEGKVDPCMSQVFEFDETGKCHQLMYENKHPNGNMSILVNAKQSGMKTLG